MDSIGDDLLVVAPERAEVSCANSRSISRALRMRTRQASECALELADVGLDAARDQVGDVVGKADRSTAAFFLRIAMRVSSSGGWMSAIRPHSKRERRRSSMSGIPWAAVGRQTMICLLRLVERVERVEELLLRRFLAGDELDVVDEQQVDACGSARGTRRPIVANGVDELVHEALGRE